MFRRKPTFAFFLAVLFALGAPMLAATNPWLAESKGLSILKAELPPCTLTSPAQNRSFTVRDCTTKISCASTGTETVRLVCDGTDWRAINATATAVDLGDYVLITKAGQQTRDATGAGNDIVDTANDDMKSVGTDIIEIGSATATRTAPVQTNVASTSILDTTPIHGISGVYERAVANVTVADDAAGTKPTGEIPITTDFATCTCNDATGCTMTIAEPTPTAGYGRSLTVYSIGTGNCEIADSAGVVETGATCVLEPTSVAVYGYVNSAWRNSSCKDNVP